MTFNSFEYSLLKTAESLHERGLLFRGAHANLSARSGDSVLMTRGGSVADLRSEDLAWLPLVPEEKPQGFDANYREIVDMHTRLYEKRGDIGAIIHCHPPHATAFAVA